MLYEGSSDKSAQGIHRARLPILLAGRIPGNWLILRIRTGQTWTDWRIGVGTRNGSFQGKAITLWLHPPLRQAFLERRAQAKNP